jgi:hypothetical protein
MDAREPQAKEKVTTPVIIIAVQNIFSIQVSPEMSP